MVRESKGKRRREKQRKCRGGEMEEWKRTKLSVYYICGPGFIVNTNEVLVDRAGALIEKVRRYRCQCFLWMKIADHF